MEVVKVEFQDLQDFKNSKEYLSSVGTNKEKAWKKEDWEKYNQRFLIHIVPVIGNIKMND